MPNHNSAFTFSFTTEGYQGINYSSPPRAITFEVESGELTVDELCSSFQDFLKACGYMLDNGTIEFVRFSDEPDIREEDYNYEPAQPEVQEDPNQQKFDFANNENVDTTGYDPTRGAV